MRDAFAAELHELMAADQRILLLAGDIGFKVFDRIVADCTGRFFNMGVAEANMLGVAAGMALSGRHPFVYTIIPFLTMRAFEQIRVDVCIQNLPVTIVGVGGGLAYGALGPTHHSIEDVAILRALPNMTIIVPCDPLESRQAIRAAAAHPGPVYVRLGKNGEPVLHRNAYEFRIGRAIQLRSGDDATIVAVGAVAKIAFAVSDGLAQQGIGVRVVDMHTIKPLDAEAILQAAHETQALVTLEEHSIIGGLGSAVAEVLAEGHVGTPFKRFGIRDTICHGVGSQEYHFQRQGLTVESVTQGLMSLIETARGPAHSVTPAGMVDA